MKLDGEKIIVFIINKCFSRPCFTQMEQNEYNKEKIFWKNISFVDNQSVLDMIGLKPCNVMSLIDEESKFPKGRQSSYL